MVGTMSSVLERKREIPISKMKVVGVNFHMLDLRLI